MNVAAIITERSITAVVKGKPYTVNRDEVNFERALELAKQEDWEGFVDCLSPAAALINFGNGRVSIDGGNVLFDGEVTHNVIADRMIEMSGAGFNVEPLANFMANLNDNPSKQAVDELYLFLEANNLAITPDGHFLAYKRVRENFHDIHSGKFDNSVGTVVSMPRNKVDDNRNNTCSAGLHFCSLEYLPHFGSRNNGHVTVIVKINPADVVSIPHDYNNSKGRTWRYEVVGIHDADDYTSAFDEPVTDFHDGEQVSAKVAPRDQVGNPEWAIKMSHVLPKESGFEKFFEDNFYPWYVRGNGIESIREYCDVESTTEFRTNSDALEAFMRIYEYWVELQPEEDGNSTEALRARATNQKRDASGRFI